MADASVLGKDISRIMEAMDIGIGVSAYQHLLIQHQDWQKPLRLGRMGLVNHFKTQDILN